MPVHNHGTEDGPGLRCNEIRQHDGSLRGTCLLTADELAGVVAPPAPAPTPAPAAPAPELKQSRTPEEIARDVIVSYLSTSPLIRARAERAAAVFSGEPDSAYLVGAALGLGALSYDGILTLMTRAIVAATEAA